ncbi:MAG: hypothetical protein KGQ41_07675 [Alphaproteobacteria bacterium]|nr:hypothetical protein [Alphaproteobacteria bacterium]
MRFLLVLLTIIAILCPQARAAEWTEEGRALMMKVMREATHKKPDFMQPYSEPMENGRGFFLIWKPEGETPSRWIVSLPGSNGLVSDELSLWGNALEGRHVGIVEVQWWMGTGDQIQDYMSPFEVYRELKSFLPRLGVKEGHAMLHGFSRGSANIYSIAAVDHVFGNKFFDVVVANSGGANLGYPPTRDIEIGRLGAQPYLGMRWVTVCGEKDPNPERDGCPAMRRTAEWIAKQGGTVVMAIEDAKHGHGALHTNIDNANKLLDWYLAD